MRDEDFEGFSGFLIFSIAAAFFLSACNDSTGRQDTMRTDEVITVNLKEAGDDFHKRYPDLVKATQQPAGLTFYNAEWSPTQKGRAKVNPGTSTLQADNILYLTATQDEAYRSEGIFTVDITSGITGPNGIDHEAARDYIFSVLSKLRGNGWKPLIPLNAPRIRGKETLEYKLRTGKSIPLDADYKPTLTEWVQLPDLSFWELYSDTAFIKISFKRSPNPKNADASGFYLVNYEVNSRDNYFRGFVDPQQRANWKKLLPDELKDLAARRRSAEAELSAQGIPIATDHVDFPVPN